MTTRTARRRAESGLPAGEGRARVVIEAVSPQIDGGRFPVKREAGDTMVVEADAFTDGHDAIACVLLHRRDDVGAHGVRPDWTETPMAPLANDRWRGEFPLPNLGRYRYAVQAWVDHFASWARDLKTRLDAGQDVDVDLLIGADLVEQASRRAEGYDLARLKEFEAALRGSAARDEQRATNRVAHPARLAAVRAALSPELAALMFQHADRSFATTYDAGLTVVVDPVLARYGAWYELFPRSCAPVPGAHGAFRDVAARLPAIAAMGFDVLYLPPIHPIGAAFRKGRNNRVVAEADEPGSPWAIGAAEGGHTAVHPQLGTLDDFRDLVQAAKGHGISIALDIAFQCSPDHPYVKEHPEWFRQRPDGTIQYAENPPKKYQDIYPFNFETERWQELWQELKNVICFWIDQGVHVFRVDNPHTKPFPFWEWLIGEVKRTHPETIFLSEAFTRPKVMYRLAKLGFSQSYTYFAWRNSKPELTAYLTELTQSEVREYFRPNLWPNTPDILTEYLQLGGRPAFMARLVLAATLGASYGIYGPAFELAECRPREPGSEEYLDSEKYEIRHWDLDRPDSLREVIARVNRIRRENPALHRNESLRFHPIDNDQLIAYSKVSPDRTNVMLVVVNLDPHHTQSGWLDLPLDELGIDPAQPYQAHDLLGDARFLWYGARNYVELNPHVAPAHIFQLRRRVRTERDFEYFL
jgi:starch synthase (maltosyl-transferring)